MDGRSLQIENIMKYLLLHIFIFIAFHIAGQIPVDLKGFNKKNGVSIETHDNSLQVRWPVYKNEHAVIQLNLENGKPLVSSLQITKTGRFHEIANDIDPGFIVTESKRDLVSQNGWNIFFDKVQLKPNVSDKLTIDKRHASVRSSGSRTVISLSTVKAGSFSGVLEITLFNGIPLMNIAAVMTTLKDSTAYLFDAGLISKSKQWSNITWANTGDELQTATANINDTSNNIAVKYRTIIGENIHGSLAIFPPPHQYFYPLDEAFNLKFTWYGNRYRNLLEGYGIGIRQDLKGDNRYVPWVNAPPGTQQRLSFFCLLSAGNGLSILNEVKRFTHNDTYLPLQGYKTMSSHFHNEFVMKVMLANKPIPPVPNFVKVFKRTGINIVHLAEFHYTAHPKGPDDQRLLELKTLFEECRRFSDKDFLLLPGEEPNEFYGGHWLNIFPKPVYWIMSKSPDQPFVKNDSVYGQVYHVGDSHEMLSLLEKEKGLAWTAHARTKSSTGFPDKYKSESFFISDRFLGAAWKAMPADLSEYRLGKRILDLIDDMNNWGLDKKVLGEADLFTVEPENEMYAHLNVNYLQLDRLPAFNESWQPILDALQKGNFFTTTGEVLIPSFTVNGRQKGQTTQLDKTGKARIDFTCNWSFPLNFAEIISGDGEKVYRHQINLSKTEAFNEKHFSYDVNLPNRKWVRLEIWDVAANGAFTQTIWLK
jgi:hypothetical protein